MKQKVLPLFALIVIVLIIKGIFLIVDKLLRVH